MKHSRPSFHARPTGMGEQMGVLPSSEGQIRRGVEICIRAVKDIKPDLIEGSPC
jgi:hypothetical protein